MTDADELALDLSQRGDSRDEDLAVRLLRPSARQLGQLAHLKGAFDPDLRNFGGQRIAHKDLNRALEPFRKIRAAVGDKMEIMVEGHGFWSLPAAKQIARALEEFQPSGSKT